MGYTPAYMNDGSGRDTFINHAGAYWLNPLPAGCFYKSPHLSGTLSTQQAITESIDPFASQRPPGRILFGKSRYGTTVLPSCDHGGYNGQAEHMETSPADVTGAYAGDPSRGCSDDAFDPEATALEHLPYDVPRPEQRLRQPGHAQTGLDGTGGSTYNGVHGGWEPPRALDNTLLRLAPTYESTCHYGLRTGRYYTEDKALPHDMSLPEKGKDWGKSRYM